MAKILVHALAATAGGGVTYLRNFLSRLNDHGREHQWIVLVPDAPEWADIATGSNVRIMIGAAKTNGLARIYFDQIGLRRFIAEEGIQAVLATGNFGMVMPPVPQILLNRNALYFSREHIRQLRRRGDVRELANILLRRRMALASIRASAMNIVPTAAFRDEICERLPNFPPERFAVIPHGFDNERFVRPDATLDEKIAAKIDRRPGVRRVLMVSHYNYFRNFETLFRGFANLLRHHHEPLELIITTKIGTGIKDHRYDTSSAARLIDELRIGQHVTMLGTTPHSQLYPLYRTADVVVCPSYSESFGHPFVEAMASGRAVVASDRPGHREICGDAALYFPTFDAGSLAECVHAVLADRKLAEFLGANGEWRARDFCWDKHFESLLTVITSSIASRRAPCPTAAA